jgi:hypothetical protein
MSAVDQLQAMLDAERQPANPLRPHQVKAYREEKERLEEVIHAPSWVEGDRGQAIKRYRSLDKMLGEQAPRKSDQANEIKRLADEVCSQHIGPAMLPREVMRRNPTGAVGAFIRQEQGPATKRAIQQWKRAQWAIDPDTEDPDHSNVERFRPEIGPQSGASTFMANAQIPGVFAMSPKAKENWPAEMPAQGTVHSALAQVQARETKPRKVRKVRAPLNEEQKQALRERLVAARAKQAEKRLAGG